MSFPALNSQDFKQNFHNIHKIWIKISKEHKKNDRGTPKTAILDWLT